MTHAITVTDVSFAYDEHPVVEDVSLTVDEGEFLGLIGPNGSGKTTLLKLMLGLERPETGTVELFGEPADAFADGERLGYVSQQSTEADRTMPVTVREVVRMGRYPHVGLNELTAADEVLVDDALKRVGIADLANRRVGRLSGGQKQRAYIARALAAEADLLALDEPTVGVDADSREQFYALLDELNDQGITIVLIEHDLGLVTEHVDRIACIDRTLHHVGDAASFLASNALVETFGMTGRALAANR